MLLVSYKMSSNYGSKNSWWENPYGIVRTKGLDIIDFQEKPVVRSHINAEVYVLEPAF